MKKGNFARFFLCRCDSNMQAIPDADSFLQPRKKGHLLKLIGRGWLSSGSWKKRFCVLDGTKLYYYENEASNGADKSSGVISLDYFDVCEEFDAKDKKNAYVFIIGTSVRGFFDNRHQFAAETMQEMQDWIRSVHDVIADARTIRSRAGRNRIGSDKVSPVSDNRVVILSQMSDSLAEEDLSAEANRPIQLQNTTKDRVRGPQGRRLPQRKSMMPSGSPSEDGLQKQRSFSLTSPNEQQEEETEEEASSDQRRISLSMEAMHAGAFASDESRQRSSSSTDQLLTTDYTSNASHRPEASHTKKPMFGRLGGQHAALTQELELKLKSGMAPGGRRFQPQLSQDDEEARTKSRTSSETEELERKVDMLNNKLNSMQSSVHGLEQRIVELKGAADNENNSTQTQIKNMLEQASSALKEIQETSMECRKALSEAHEAREEHKTLLEECREVLNELKNARNPTPADES